MSQTPEQQPESTPETVASDAATPETVAPEAVAPVAEHATSGWTPVVPQERAPRRFGRAVVAAVAAGLLVVGGAAGFALGHGTADRGPDTAISRELPNDDQRPDTGERGSAGDQGRGTPPGMTDGEQGRPGRGQGERTRQDDSGN
ncbi:hypothetical protein [Actinokineospora globicatena]|uniref:Uncharacterized protein n=1 Tax=Actinokineospora globicatena TaxID=103729 RepID=A0A9W6V8M1_9PSEU|nr:hypothetical protein [Actinokineospora globicatena]GLW90111.1 hypothetical protein Aglo03_09270 [Actinokineospora globicatena]